MKKLVVAIIIIGAFVLYSFVYHNSSASAVLPGNSATSSSSTGSSSTSASSTPGAAGSSGGNYKDGSYTGSLADAQWGNIQVKAIIKSGKITDVQFLQYPNERDRSVLINQYADPQLTSEAIQAQSANVDIISGATDTSEAFMQSLSDALSQAQA
ncbi:MAG TPA: FMN-binding protein [Ktedonobacteraceae bacterium]